MGISKAVSRMTNPTFLLGLGVQKAGTTWLHDYLTSSPVAEFGFKKEYHVWDLRSQMGEKARANFLKALSGRLANARNPSGYSKAAMRAAFIGNPEFYFDYFSQILHCPGINLTGDITPNYCLLPEDELSVIRDGFISRGIRVKALLLLRDPVFRFRSMVRMHNRAQKVSLSADAEFRLLLEKQMSGADSLRSNYRDIISRSRAVFGEDLLISFYEELFNPQAVAMICEFLEIPFHLPDLDKKVNASPLTGDFVESHYRALSLPYLEQLPFLSEIFGADRMASTWPMLHACL